MNPIKMARKYTIDFCNGPLFSKIILFTIPLVSSLLLLLAFNTADYIVVGRYASSRALAAVGATSSLTNLLTMFFFGLSVGGNVVAGNAFGAKDYALLKNTARTSLSVSIVGGIGLGILGIAVSPLLLRMMNTPEEILPLSIKYMRILFCGMLFTSAYTFGSAFLRAVGDTRRPLIFLSIAGVVNVGLNLVFVICFHMDVDGVALATVISKGMSAFLVWNAIGHMEEVNGLPLRKLRINWDILKRMLGIGVPSGLQSFSFNIANIFIQTSMNSFGAVALAGNTAALSIEHLLSTVGSGFHQTAISFAAQNVGGRKFARLKKGTVYCCVTSSVTVLVISMIMLVFGRQLLSMFTTSNQDVIKWGMVRMMTTFPFYFAGGLMNALTGAMRGSGHSTAAFVVVLVGACIFRILWILLVFPHYRTMRVLYMAFSISWVLISIGCMLFLWRAFKMLPAK